MKKTTGKENYEILDAGTVITFKGEPIIFHLTPELKLSMAFKTDKELKNQKMDYSINNDVFDLILINFNNSLGTTNAEPLPIAKINNYQIYLNFVIYAIEEDSNKIVHYTWYQREEVANG